MGLKEFNEKHPYAAQKKTQQFLQKGKTQKQKKSVFKGIAVLFLNAV